MGSWLPWRPSCPAAAILRPWFLPAASGKPEPQIARVNAIVLAPQADLPHRPRLCATDDRAADRRRGWTPTTPLLQQADERVRSHGVPAAPSVFLYGDVWGGNMPWWGDRCVALIDWKGAGVGDPGVDLNTPTVLHGWVPGFAGDGSPLDAAAVTERRDAFLRAALDQLPARIS